MQSFKVGQCQVDPPLNRVVRDGSGVQIEPRVMQLLCHLAEHPGEVLSRAALLGAVWPGRVVEDEALSAAMAKLRRALGDRPRDPHYVETIPKRGYRLIAPVQPTGGRAANAMAEDPERAPHVAARPGIAVLQFDNYSAAGERQILADGLAEDISTALSRIRWLRVVSRASVRRFAPGAPADRIADAVDVDFIVRGSIRADSDSLRVNVVLEDAPGGAVLWSERYDRPHTDMFAIEDDICDSLFGQLELEIGGAIRARIRGKPPASMTSWEAFHRGLAARHGVIGVELTEAKRYFRQAIDLEPGFAAPKAALALALINELNQLIVPAGRRQETWLEVERLAGEAVRSDPWEPLGYVARARTHSMRGRHQSSIIDADTALSLNPSSATAHIVRAEARGFGGDARAALEDIEAVRSLSPADPYLVSQLYATAAIIYLRLGQFAEAAHWAQSGVEMLRRPIWSRAALAAALFAQGETERALATARALVAQRPEFTCSTARRRQPESGVDEFWDWFVDTLAECGVPR